MRDEIPGDLLLRGCFRRSRLFAGLSRSVKTLGLLSVSRGMLWGRMSGCSHCLVHISRSSKAAPGLAVSGDHMTRLPVRVTEQLRLLAIVADPLR